MRPFRILPLLLVALAGCPDVEDHDTDPDDNHGLVTRVELTFTPGAGDPLVFTWADPENDGSPAIDPIVLPDDSTDANHAPRAYALTVRLFNDLVEPVEEVTSEIEEDSEDHQLFYLGSAVLGPATGSNTSAVVEHAYDDTDAGGLPIGLANTITTTALGSGDLNVVLRHLPPENGEPLKVDGLAATVASEGFGAIGGDNDVDVTFPLTVE